MTQQEATLMKLTKLADQLMADGKSDTAKFLCGLRDRLRIPSTRRQAKAEVSRMASIVQYGNFSAAQESIFYQLQDEIEQF